MTIKAIIFDLGKVLIDFDHGLACEKLSQLTKSASASEIHDFLFKSGLENQFELGNIQPHELHDKFQSHFQCNVKFSEMEFACCDIFTPIEPSIQLLEAIKIKFPGKLILLSNTNVSHWNFINARWRFIDLFDDYILSFQVKKMKPSPEIYQWAVRKASCLPHECFFTDDLPQNIDGAKALGIQSVLFSSANQIREQLEYQGVRV